MTGIPRNRIVAVVSGARNRKRVGSGYLILPDIVLTASHCLTKGSAEVPVPNLQVVLSGVGSVIIRDVIDAAPEFDIALAYLESPLARNATIPEIAYVDRRYSGELEDCTAVGYPIWQFDSTRKKRGLAEIHGTIRVFDDVEFGLMVLRDSVVSGVSREHVNPPGKHTATPTDGSSESDIKLHWSGMSGAPVFVEGQLLGVVLENHPRQGPTALRLQPLAELLNSDQAPPCDF